MSAQQTGLATPAHQRRAAEEHVELVCAAIRSIRLTQAALPESEIRDQVAARLQAAGLKAQTEVPFGPACRADVLADPGVVIEIKRNKPSPKRLQRQLDRYARQRAVNALVVVTERRVDIPPILRGKPCRCIALQSLWGIAV